MKITAIRQQVKRQGRYSIFLGGRYVFSLSDRALLESKLRIGQDLNEGEVKKLKQLSMDDKLYNNALAYAALRSRSTWEMEQYLERKKASPTLMKQILNRLSDTHILNDREFAKAWIANRRLLKATSRRRLLQELRAKRVPEEIAQKALEQDQQNEQLVLRELIVKKRKQSRYQDNQKLMQYLARQGFSYGDIKDVLDRWREDS